MADVFLSYAKADRDQAAEIAHYLEKNGFTVWWDSALVAGDDFSNIVKQQLDAARYVIVIWTAHSIKSAWVRAEATQALSSQKLIQLRSDDLPVSALPLPFGSMHSATILESQHDNFLLKTLALIGGSPETNKPARQSRDDTAVDKSSTPRSDGTSLTAPPEVQAYDVFVAYSRKDRRFCEDLVVKLRGQELNVFYDQFLKAGDEWRAVIARNIRRSAVFVVLLSQDSISSPEVTKELNMAAAVSASIIPIRVDGASLPDAFQLILGGVNIVDSTIDSEAVMDSVAQQAKTLVAVRAFNERRSAPARQSNSAGSNREANDEKPSRVQFEYRYILVGLTLIGISTYATTILLREFKLLESLSLLERWVTALAFLGIPYAMVIMAISKLTLQASSIEIDRK